MLICPKCKSQYQEGYKTCNDCNEALIEISEVVEKDTTTRDYGIRKTLIGIALLISSTLAYVGISISATIYGLYSTEWITDQGKIGTALTENALLFIPFIITTIMFVMSLAILFHEYYSRTDK